MAHSLKTQSGSHGNWNETAGHNVSIIKSKEAWMLNSISPLYGARDPSLWDAVLTFKVGFPPQGNVSGNIFIDTLRGMFL